MLRLFEICTLQVYWIQKHVFIGVWHSKRVGILLYVIFAEILFWGVVAGVLHWLGIYWKLWFPYDPTLDLVSLSLQNSGTFVIWRFCLLIHCKHWFSLLRLAPILAALASAESAPLMNLLFHKRTHILKSFHDPFDAGIYSKSTRHAFSCSGKETSGILLCNNMTAGHLLFPIQPPSCSTSFNSDLEINRNLWWHKKQFPFLSTFEPKHPANNDV